MISEVEYIVLCIIQQELTKNFQQINKIKKIKSGPYLGPPFNLGSYYGPAIYYWF
jgi:hypothetical protein